MDNLSNKLNAVQGGCFVGNICNNHFLHADDLCCFAPKFSWSARFSKCMGTCGLSVTTFFHQVLNYYYLTVYIMFKPKMSLEGSVH